MFGAVITLNVNSFSKKLKIKIIIKKYFIIESPIKRSRIENYEIEEICIDQNVEIFLKDYNLTHLIEQIPGM